MSLSKIKLQSRASQLKILRGVTRLLRLLVCYH